MDILIPRTRARFGKLEGIVLATYSLLVGWSVAHHEPWVDEAQAWLLARDLSITDLFGKYLHYEGTPGLWHLFLWILCRLHVSYAFMHWISAAVAVAGVWVFLRFSPFPSILRATIPFTCFLLYQYAVIARSYVAIPLFVFAAAALFEKPGQNLIKLSVVLGLLSNLSSHGFLLSVGFALSLAIRLWRQRKDQKGMPSIRRIAFAGAILAISWLFSIWTAWPAPDNSYDPPSTMWHLTALVIKMMPIGLSRFAPLSLFIGTSVFAYLVARRRYWDIAPCVLLQIFFAVVLVRPWHIGIMFIAVVGVVWINWPSNEAKWLSWDRSLAIVLLVSVLDQCAVSISDISTDTRLPYSGDEGAAMFLRDRVPGKRVAGISYFSVGLLPYFPTNIYENQPKQSFWYWSKASREVDQLSVVLKEHPDFVVLGMAWMNVQHQTSGREFMSLIMHLTPPVKKQIEEGSTYRETHRFCGDAVSGFTYHEGLCQLIFEPQANIPQTTPQTQVLSETGAGQVEAGQGNGARIAGAR